MSGVGIIEGSDVATVIANCKMTTGLTSYGSGQTLTSEYQFNTFVPQGVVTNLRTVPVVRTPGKPQRYLYEVRLNITANNGGGNSPVRFMVGSARAGITTVQTFTITPITYQSDTTFGSPPLNVTVTNPYSNNDAYHLIGTAISISNTAAWVEGTIKVIGVTAP
jgi:hypothetical protein